MTGRGGARAGAGRKSKQDKHKLAINRAEKQIKDRLPDLIDNLFELAEGVEVQEVDKDGKTRIYSRPPDRQANEYLINRIMGKPVERTETEATNETTHVFLTQFSAALEITYGKPSDHSDAPVLMPVNGNGHSQPV